jgi:hypothetical protein
VSLIVSSIGAVARAEPAATRQSARAAMRNAERMRAAGDLEGALERFRAAYAILRTPTSGLEVAKTQAALGLLVEARLVASETAALPSEPAEPAEFAAARRAASDLAAEIEPRMPILGVVVTPTVKYTLRIDGRVVPDELQALRFRVNPGEHEVEIDAPGYQRASQAVMLGEGVYQLVQLSLSHEPEPAAAATPSAAPIAAQMPPAAPAAQTPPAAPAAQTPPAAPAAPPRVDLSVPDDPHRGQRIRGYVVVVASSIVLATGAVAGMASFADTSNAKHDCPNDVCPESLRKRLESADTLANFANFALPIGALGLAYGLFELLTLPDDAAPKLGARVQVQVDARGAYAAVRGEL